MKEVHVIIKSDSVEGALSYCRMLEASHPSWKAVFKRYFLSNREQRSLLPCEHGAVSCVIQPPLDGSALAMWVYFVENAELVAYGTRTTIVKDDGLEHFWEAGALSSLDGPELQTSAILEQYEKNLNKGGMDISRECVRTWFFCHDIDNNYDGLVKARRENFASHGLTPQTHFIASTGIAGTPTAEGSVIQMDAWAIKGPVVQKYLYAPSHLNPTYEYGVTFERGVRLDYSGAAHCIISGTASIDNKGKVLHPGDVKAQTFRMWENIEKLLEEGGMGWRNARVALVYLRHPSDYDMVANLFAEKFPSLPYIILHAAVCRPEWLIEMECIAQN